MNISITLTRHVTKSQSLNFPKEFPEKLLDMSPHCFSKVLQGVQKMSNQKQSHRRMLRSFSLFPHFHLSLTLGILPLFSRLGSQNSLLCQPSKQMTQVRMRKEHYFQCHHMILSDLLCISGETTSMSLAHDICQYG